MATDDQMTPNTLSQKLDAWLEWMGDKLNPILVKETRQAIKSRQFILWFVLLLVACWITTIGAVFMIGPSIYYVSTGGILMLAYYGILTFPLLIVVPFSAYRSLSLEQEANTRDLLEVSTLTPRQIINGKLGSAMLQATVYLSALAPCIAFTYLLRGISVDVIALLLFYAVLASFGLSMVGLLFAAITKQKRSQVAISLGFAALLFVSFWGILTFAMQVMGSGQSLLSNDDWWLGNGLLLFSLYFTTLVLVYFATVGLTTFVSANRSTPLRIAMLAQQTVFIAWVASFAGVSHSVDILTAALMFGVVYWYLAGALMVGETPQLSHRIRRTLPQSWAGRIFFTWLNPGPGSGFVFAVVNITCLVFFAILAVFLFFVNSKTSYADFTDMLFPVQGVLLWGYAVAYLGLGRLIVYGLRRIAPFSMLGSFLVLVLLLLGGSALPVMMDSMTDSIRVARYPLLHYPSPFWSISQLREGMYSKLEVLTLMITVLSTALVLLVINLIMAAHEMQQLRVARPQRVKEDDRLKNRTPEQIVTNPWGDTAKPVLDD